MLCETWWEVLCNPVGGCFGPTSGTKRALCCMVSAKTRQCYLRPASISCLPLRPPWPLESPRLVLLFFRQLPSPNRLFQPSSIYFFFTKVGVKKISSQKNHGPVFKFSPHPQLYEVCLFFFRTIAIFFVFCCTRTLWFSSILGYSNDSDLICKIICLLFC